MFTYINLHPFLALLVFFEDISVYLFSHVTSDINSLAAAAAKRMNQFIGPVKNDLLHYWR